MLKYEKFYYLLFYYKNEIMWLVKCKWKYKNVKYSENM